MKTTKIDVPFYKWKIVSLVAESYEDFSNIAKSMRKYYLGDDCIADVKEMFDSRISGGAIVYYNNSRLFILIVVCPHTDTVELASTLVHEGRHAADRIISVTQLDGVEGPAYLNEFITINLIKDYIAYKKFEYETDKSEG